MATTKGSSKKKSASKAVVAATSRVRQATVKEAVTWLNKPSAAAGTARFSRVITAIRDPNDAHRIITIVIHE